MIVLDMFDLRCFHRREMVLCDFLGTSAPYHFPHEMVKSEEPIVICLPFVLDIFLFRSPSSAGPIPLPLEVLVPQQERLAAWWVRNLENDALKWRSVLVLCFWLIYGVCSLADVTQVLSELELIIQRVKVSTTPDGRVMDLFFVTDNMWDSSLFSP